MSKMERKNYRKTFQNQRKPSRRVFEHGRSELKSGASFYVLSVHQENKSIDLPDEDRGFIRVIPKVVTALLVPDIKLIQMFIKSSSEIHPEEHIAYQTSKDIIRIKRFIRYNDLNPNEELILLSAIQKHIESSPESFLDAINHAPSLSLTKHSLELLPNVGKKTMQTLVKEISIKKFESLEDLKKRGGIGVNVLAERVVEELKSDDEKLYMFVKWKTRKDKEFDRNPSHDSRGPRKQMKRTAPYKKVGEFQNHR